MKIIIKIIILLSIWFMWLVLDSSIEPLITETQEKDLRVWFDKATDLKTEISCSNIENFA